MTTYKLFNPANSCYTYYTTQGNDKMIVQNFDGMHNAIEAADVVSVELARKWWKNQLDRGMIRIK